MIGIIGPPDSTALAIAVANDEGIGHEVLGRAYEQVSDAVGLATELDQLCQVLLFTGRVPYAGARAAGTLKAALQYVPHGGADLYRALVHLQRRYGGRLPRMSLDTIEPTVVAEAYEDLDPELPTHILPLGLAGEPERVRAAADIAAFHRERFMAGDVEVCVTCLESVHRDLVESGIPSFRIAHTRTVLRDSLRQAHLAARLAITEAMQPAAVLIRLASASTSTQPGSYEAQRRRLLARIAVLDTAEALHGRMAQLDEETLIVYADRTAVEAALARLTTERNGPLALTRRGLDALVGIGFAATVPAAEENARRALVMGERYGDLHVALPDGDVVLANDRHAPAAYRLRETNPPTLELGRRLGLGPLALARLLRAIRQIDASSFTAADLARAYSIEPRSARRLLTSLMRAGIAIRLGVQSGPRAGRPETIYRLDVSQLMPADAPAGPRA